MAFQKVLLVCALCASAAGSTCPGANPNDELPDDAALQACLAASSVLLLDPPAPGGPGYIIAEGLIAVNNGTTIVSSAPPAKAVLLAAPTLAWPMLSTNGTLVGLTLAHLLVDGNRDARAAVSATLCSAAAGARNDNYRTTNVMLPGFRFPEAPVWRCWDPWERFVADVQISNCTLTQSPCGAGVGISGRDYILRDNTIVRNGWDLLHNPQNLGFPYADGINAAVCTNGTIERNTLVDNSNMVIAAGAGPYCLVQHNFLTQTAGVSQNGVNVWPTNSGEASPWWHPEAWSFAHSAVYNNSIVVSRSAEGDVGMFSGIAVGGIPWSASAWEPACGDIVANAVDSANVGLLVDGVTGGTVFGNSVTRPYGGGSPTNCNVSLAYTAADANGTILQPGAAAVAFRQGPCEPATPAPLSASDGAAFVSLTLDGVLNPSTASVRCGAAMRLALTFANSGSSSWAHMPGGLGVQAGDANTELFSPPLPAPYAVRGSGIWGVARAPLGYAVTVAPSAAAVLEVNLTAPAAPGTYTLQWRMLHAAVAWFGEASHAVAVHVDCAIATTATDPEAPPQSLHEDTAVAPPVPPSPAAAALQGAIVAAIASGAPSVTAQPGTYAFGAYNLHITGARLPLAIEGAGATLIFAPGYGVVVVNASDTQLSGFTIDYDPPCFTQGVIVAVTGAAGDREGCSIDVALEAGFALPNTSFFDSSEIKLQFFDASRRDRLPDQLTFQPATVVGPVSGGPPGVWRFASVAGWSTFVPAVGHLATVSPRLNTTGFVIPDYYGGNALNVLASARVVVVDVTVLGSGNFGVLEWGGAGGHVYSRLNISRPRSHLLSTNCDGLHSFGTGTGAQLVDSAVAWTGDDVVNFHSRVGLLLADVPPGATALAVVDVGDVPSPWLGAAKPLRAIDELQAGDNFRVFQPGQTGALVAQLAAAAAAARDDDPALLASARQLLQDAGFSGRVNPSAVAVYRVVTRAAAAVQLSRGQVVQFDARGSRGGALRNTTAHDIYDSCGRLQADGVTLAGLRCSRARTGLTVAFDFAFLEGSRALQGVAVVDNAFVAVGWPPANNMSGIVSADADARVTVANNTVEAA